MLNELECFVSVSVSVGLIASRGKQFSIFIDVLFICCLFFSPPPRFRDTKIVILNNSFAFQLIIQHKTNILYLASSSLNCFCLT